MRVGNKIEFWEGGLSQDQPYAGLITRLIDDNTVNLVAFDYGGNPRGFVNVPVADRVEIKDAQGKVIGYNRCCQLV